MALLEINQLSVEFPSRFGIHTAVTGFDLTLERGEIHGLVGESGAGKTTIGSAVLGLLPGAGRISAGSIALDGKELTTLDSAQWHALRGSRISTIFQDPQTSLNPLLTIEEQLVETIRCHLPLNQSEAKDRALDLLDDVGIREATSRLDDYPHQFSGGMRQRVVIALALASEPDLVIADEPTTALDVAVQKQILVLIRRLTAERGLGVLLVTHDMGVIAEVTDSVSVLLDGRCVEAGPTTDVLGQPREPYTRGLVASVPRMERRMRRFPQLVPGRESTGDADWAVAGADADVATEWLLDRGVQSWKDGPPVIEVDGLTVDFTPRSGLFRKRNPTRAVDGASFRIGAGETLGLVGESGSGKSTVAKAVVGVHPAADGQVSFMGRDLDVAGRRPANDPSRREIQLVFQDPYSSLDNRWRVLDLIAEPLRCYGLVSGKAEMRRIVASMLALVGMPQSALLRYPHQFSGGQRQRIAIARALVSRPKLLICDEPTSALDVSVQAQVLNLFRDIQAQFGLAILFISHNLPVVRQMADQVAVMHQGKIVESGPAEPFFAGPRHPYSNTLLAEMPSLALLCDPAALSAETG